MKGFVEKWLEGRLKKPSYIDDCIRLRKHVFPRFGHLAMVAVKPTTIDDLITDLRENTTLAPSTIRKIAGLSQVFKRACTADTRAKRSSPGSRVIPSNPVQWEAGTLPPQVDKDPTWRAQAIFTREEAAILIYRPRQYPGSLLVGASATMTTVRRASSMR